MASKKQTKADTEWQAAMDGMVVPDTARRLTSELPPQRKLEEGGRVGGIFQHMKMIEINDVRTKAKKSIAVYTFRDHKNPEERFAVLGGRVGLDAAFQNLADDEGGWDSLKGQMVLIERGTDTKRDDKTTVGNYSLACWMPEAN
jgi:hypothetical protein